MIRPTRNLFFLIASSTPVILNAQWLGFRINQVIPATHRMYNMKLAHSDKDTFKDLVTLPVDEFNSVWLYKGTEGSNFSYSQSFQKDTNYRILETADLNDDGFDDLILSAYWNNGFKLFWADGNGGYTDGQHYGLTGHGRNIEVTDLNGDGALDVAALSGGSGQPITLHVFHGNKSKELTLKGIYPSQLDTDKRITIVDKNQDGLPDIMVASSFPLFVIFYQEANGGFTPRYWPYTLEFPFTSEYFLADFNNDDKADILAYYYDEGFRFYEGLQDTLFSETYHALPFKANAYAVVTVDINLDGNTDIVMGHKTDEFESTDAVYYLPGNGDFTFEEPTVFTFPAPIDHLLVDDFNSDGFPDLIGSCANLGIVTATNEGLTTGSEEEREESLKLFPNPFTDHIKIELRESSVSIYNIKGILVEKISTRDKAEIHTGSWQPGMYFARIVQGKKVFNRKIVKE